MKTGIALYTDTQNKLPIDTHFADLTLVAHAQGPTPTKGPRCFFSIAEATICGVRTLQGGHR
jgi:hypothetical protein